jgi:hypothetical protein
VPGCSLSWEASASPHFDFFTDRIVGNQIPFTGRFCSWPHFKFFDVLCALWCDSGESRGGRLIKQGVRQMLAPQIEIWKEVTMKTNLLRTCVVSLLAVTGAFAQSSALKAYVPFDFIVGSQTLPAGQYTVDRGPAPNTLTIRSDDHKNATAIALSGAAYAVIERNKGSLVFHRYGRTYFLSEVWNPVSGGHTLPPTSRERELAAKMTAPVNTTVAAVR